MFQVLRLGSTNIYFLQNISLQTNYFSFSSCTALLTAKLSFCYFSLFHCDKLNVVSIYVQFLHALSSTQDDIKKVIQKSYTNIKDVRRFGTSLPDYYSFIQETECHSIIAKGNLYKTWKLCKNLGCSFFIHYLLFSTKKKPISKKTKQWNKSQALCI